MDISPILTEFVSRTGKWSLIVAVFLIAFNHWQLIVISSKLFLDMLYFYVLINAIFVSPFLYLERRRKLANVVCPYCGEVLRMLPQYKCPHCGKIKAEK